MNRQQFLQLIILLKAVMRQPCAHFFAPYGSPNKKPFPLGSSPQNPEKLLSDLLQLL
jgi:hypothetical protein